MLQIRHDWGRRYNGLFYVSAMIDAHMLTGEGLTDSFEQEKFRKLAPDCCFHGTTALLVFSRIEFHTVCQRQS